MIDDLRIKNAILEEKLMQKMRQAKYYKRKYLEDHRKLKEVREYIEENQEEHKFTDRGGFTYTEGHFLRDSDTLLEILDKEKENGDN